MMMSFSVRQRLHRLEMLLQAPATLHGRTDKRDFSSLVQRNFTRSLQSLLILFEPIMTNFFLLARSMLFFYLHFLGDKTSILLLLIIYMKKFIHSDWLRAVQFFF